MPEEASALNIPILTARYVSDRPETISAGCNRLVGLEKENIMKELRAVMDDPATRDAMRNVPSPYGDGNTSSRIVDILERLHSEENLLGFEKEITKKNV